MRHSLFGTVAAAVILAAPAGASAQSQPVPIQKHEPASGERAKIDAMLDQAAMPTQDADARRSAGNLLNQQTAPIAPQTAKVDDASAVAPEHVSSDAAIDPARRRTDERGPTAAWSAREKSPSPPSEQDFAARDAIQPEPRRQTTEDLKEDRLATRDERAAPDRTSTRSADAARVRVRASNSVDVRPRRGRTKRDVPASVSTADRSTRVVGPELHRAARERVVDRETARPSRVRTDDRRRFDELRVADRVESPRMSADLRAARRYVRATPSHGMARMFEMQDGRVLLVRPRIAYRTYQVVTVVEE